MSEELKLLDCPFCGGEAEYEGLYCYCTRCGCRMADDPDESEAIAAWNRRASTTTEGEGEAYIENDHARFQDEIDRLTRERDDARREALEEAAKAIENHGLWRDVSVLHAIEIVRSLATEGTKQ